MKGGAKRRWQKLRGVVRGVNSHLQPCSPGVQRQPWTVCWLVLAASVGSRCYDARARALTRRLARTFGVPWQWVRCAEIAFCREIIKHTSPVLSAPRSDDAADGWLSKTNITRYCCIGGGAAAGGILLAVTGGLAAPAAAAGLGILGAAVAGVGVVGAGAASFAAAVASFGGLGTALGVSFGAAGAGLAGYKMSRRVGDVHEFEFDLIDCSPGLPVTICVHGWIDETDPAACSAWSIWEHVISEAHCFGGEYFALRWESEELRALGKALSRILENAIQGQLVNAGGNMVLGAAFAAAALPLTMLSSLDYVDNAWSVAQERADLAAEQLARTLLLRVHGNRPVNLVGYGMGARMIIKCLLILSQAPKGRGFGIVESAVLLGTPYAADREEWANAASVCALRLVNAYNSSDWLLSIAYRATLGDGLLVAGLSPVPPINGNETTLENVDLTPFLPPHSHGYFHKLPLLLSALGLDSGVVDLEILKDAPADSTLDVPASVIRLLPSGLRKGEWGHSVAGMGAGGAGGPGGVGLPLVHAHSELYVKASSEVTDGAADLGHRPASQ